MLHAFRTMMLGLATIVPLLLAGCAAKPPAIVPARGVVLLDGKPLPNAAVQFIPQLEHFGAEFNSQGITDNEGRFTLSCLHKQQPGAAAVKHKVVIVDHIPADYRSPRGETQAELANYLASLRNRPIPEMYSQLAKTPLEVEVTAGQEEYTLNLTR